SFGNCSGFCRASAACLGLPLARRLDFIPTHPPDIENDQDVDTQDCPVEFAGPANYFVNFEWKVDASGDDGQPLRPRALPPQTVAFSEAKSSVANGDSGDHGYAGA